MAHRCWAIDEIVRAIVANLVSNEKRASAVALASCSKSLQEPALGEVWRSLCSLVPLVTCFPSEVWQFLQHRLIFRRAPLEAEWIRFQQKYASKVRHLWIHYSVANGVALSLPALHILQLYSSGRPLLPNLISLKWYSDEADLPILSLFISPSLKSITLFVPRKATLLPPILKKLSDSTSNIREIDISMYGSDRQLYRESMEEATSQLLMHCNRLRKFNFDSPISAAALRHLIQLPSLEELSLVVHSFQLPDPLPILVFPSLRKLYVECNGDSSWMKMLPIIENSVLTSITVDCLGLDVERFMEEFQQTVARCGIQESLRELKWKCPDGFQVTPQMIPHLSFRHLTILSLLTKCSDLCSNFDLTDDDIDLLTNAMPPCLKNLALGAAPCGVPSQITLKSLYTISLRFPRLNHLEIHFNPAQFIDAVLTECESWDVALGISDIKTQSSDMCSITTIFVGHIPLPEGSDASSILALALLGVFPCLEFIHYDNEDWAEVDRLVKVFRLVGCSAFGKGL